MRLDLEDGKYSLVHDQCRGTLHAYRDGQVWKNLNGDALVLAMFEEIARLRGQTVHLPTGKTATELELEVRRLRAVVDAIKELINRT